MEEKVWLKPDRFVGSTGKWFQGMWDEKKASGQMFHRQCHVNQTRGRIYIKHRSTLEPSIWPPDLPKNPKDQKRPVLVWMDKTPSHPKVTQVNEVLSL